MEDAELRGKIEALEKKIDAVYVSSEKTRKYFLAILIVSAVLFVLPLLALPFALPSFLSTYSALGSF